MSLLFFFFASKGLGLSGMVSMAQSSSAASTTSECSELKRASDDIGWEYGFLVNPNKERWRCKLCDREYGGGVYRLKQHIANIKGNVAPCPKSTMEDKEKCKIALDKMTSKKRDYMIDDVNVRAEVEWRQYKKVMKTKKLKFQGQGRGPIMLVPWIEWPSIRT